MTDNDQLKEMCDKVDLFDYVSQQLEPKKKQGINWFFTCPNHVDKTPSLSVNTQKNYFYCFSCGVGGNILSWMMKMEHLTFNQAVEKLGRLTGTELKNLKQCETMKVFKKMRSCSSQTTEPLNRVYMMPESYDEYSVDYPQEWIDEGITKDAMRKFNIRVDNISNRIVYPVYDSAGKYICPKGRTRFKAYKEMGLSKYINYGKIGTTDFFVGMKENRDEILATKKIIIFEGIKSVLKAYGWGYKNCVAAETSALNEEQIKLLISLGVKDVTIAFDSDVDVAKINKAVYMLRRFAKVYIIKDTHQLLGEKEAPVDRGKEVFEQLLNERVQL